MLKWNKPRVGLFVLRLALGTIFLLHGVMDLTGGRESFVREMLVMVGWSLPDALWWVVTVTEVLGGLALLLGLFTREAATLLALEMVGATLLFHLHQGFFIVAVPNAPLAYGFEYHIALVGGLACLALSGPGKWALASLLGSRRGGDRNAAVEATAPRG